MEEDKVKLKKQEYQKCIKDKILNVNDKILRKEIKSIHENHKWKEKMKIASLVTTQYSVEVKAIKIDNLVSKKSSENEI